MLDPDPQVMMGYDRIPKGDVEIRRSSPVTTSDGRLSQLRAAPGD